MIKPKYISNCPKCKTPLTCVDDTPGALTFVSIEKGKRIETHRPECYGINADEFVCLKCNDHKIYMDWSDKQWDDWNKHIKKCKRLGK